jgi:hypothetical protein
MGGPGGRPVEDGAARVLWAVLLDDDGPSGGFFRDGAIPGEPRTIVAPRNRAVTPLIERWSSAPPKRCDSSIDQSRRLVMWQQGQVFKLKGEGPGRSGAVGAPLRLEGRAVKPS